MSKYELKFKVENKEYNIFTDDVVEMLSFLKRNDSSTTSLINDVKQEVSREIPKISQPIRQSLREELPKFPAETVVRAKEFMDMSPSQMTEQVWEALTDEDRKSWMSHWNV